MDTRQAYNQWADQYDSNENKTRDLEAIALRETLEEIQFDNCLEIGCGTGKNTEWLVRKVKQLVSVDFSDEMLAKARAKIKSGRVQFIQADIHLPWNFIHELFDLVSFSLVLEHIENLGTIFEKASSVLKPGGYIYVGELHPFKQYTGTKARFDGQDGLQVLECFNHHISDFIKEASNHGLEIFRINEYFDNNDRSQVPRILSILFRKVQG